MSKIIKKSYTFTLYIDKEEFLKYAIPLVNNIDQEIENELYQTIHGMWDGVLPAGWTWETMFYNELLKNKKIQLTELGINRFQFTLKKYDRF